MQPRGVGPHARRGRSSLSAGWRWPLAFSTRPLPRGPDTAACAQPGVLGSQDPKLAGSLPPQHLLAVCGPDGCLSTPTPPKALGPALGAEQDLGVHTHQPHNTPRHHRAEASRSSHPPGAGFHSHSSSLSSWRSYSVKVADRQLEPCLPSPGKPSVCWTRTTLIFNSSENLEDSPAVYLVGEIPCAPGLSGGPLLGEGSERHGGWPILLAPGGPGQWTQAHPHANTHMPHKGLLFLPVPEQRKPRFLWCAPLWHSTAPHSLALCCVCPGGHLPLGVLALPSPPGPQPDSVYPASLVLVNSDCPHPPTGTFSLPGPRASPRS